MQEYAARMQIGHLVNEVAQKTLDGTLTQKRMNEIEAETKELETQIRTPRHQDQLHRCEVDNCQVPQLIQMNQSVSASKNAVVLVAC
jgi:hypothetical protein